MGDSVPKIAWEKIARKMIIIHCLILSQCHWLTSNDHLENSTCCWDPHCLHSLFLNFRINHTLTPYSRNWKILPCQMCFRMVALLCTLMQFFIPQSVLKTQHTMNYLICWQWQAAQLKNNQKDNLGAITFNFRKLHFFGYYTLYDYFFLNTYIVCTFEFMVWILYNYSLKHLLLF